MLSFFVFDRLFGEQTVVVNSANGPTPELTLNLSAKLACASVLHYYVRAAGAHYCTGDGPGP